MGRSWASSSKKPADGNHQQNPDAVERNRLKKLAFAKDILSQAPTKPHSPLPPSQTVVKHNGKDILRKSQRKNRFLFSFPGLLAPVGGGKIGELKDLGTKNPVLYLDFPQGQMKLFGTIVYPKNRYLTLQFSRGGKSVMCEDYFDNMIVFSDVWWIGKKEENPEEARLEFPKELIEGKQVECDFKGGAGATSVNKQVVHRTGTKFVEEEPSETELENDLSDDKNILKDLKEDTAVRHSERNAGKTFKFAEISSGDDSVESIPNEEEEAAAEQEKKIHIKTSSALDINSVDAREGNHISGQISSLSETKPKKLSDSVISMAKSTQKSHSNHGSLVQATISTLLKKVEEKTAPKTSRKSSSSKACGQKSGRTDLKRKLDQAEGFKKRGKVTGGKKAGTRTKAKKKAVYVNDEDDDIEEFSSSSKDSEGSDEDWEA